MPLQLKLSPNHHFALLKTKQRVHNSLTTVVNLVTFKDSDSLCEARELNFLQIRNPLTRRAPSPAPPYATQNVEATAAAPAPAPAGPGGAGVAPPKFDNASFLSGDGVYDSRGSNGGSGKRELGSFAATDSSAGFSSVMKGTRCSTPSESRTSSRGKGTTTTTTTTTTTNTTGTSSTTSHRIQPDERLPTIHVGPHTPSRNLHNDQEDGGIKGHLSVLAAWLCLFCSVGLISSMATLQSEFQTRFLSDFSSYTISWILTLPIFLTFILYQPFTLLINSLTPGKILFPSSVLTVLGICMLSLSHEYYQIILSHGVCTGIGIAGVFTTGLTLLRNRRTLVVSFAVMGSSVGGVVFPIMISKLILRTGFSSGIRWTALVVGVLLIVAHLFSFSSSSTPLSSAATSHDASSSSSAKRQHLNIILYAFACFLLSWGLFIPIYFLPTNSTTQSSLSEYLIPTMASGSIPGILLCNILSSSPAPSLPILTATSFLSGCFVLAIWYPSNTHDTIAVIIIFALVYGFSAAAVVCSMVTSVTFARNLEGKGKMVYLVAMAVGALTGVPLAGVILKDVGFKGLVGFSGGSMLAGSLLVGVVWLMSRKRRRASSSSGRDDDLRVMESW